MNLIPIYTLLSVTVYAAWFIFSFNFWFEKSRGKDWGIVAAVFTAFLPLAIIITIGLNL